MPQAYSSHIFFQLLRPQPCHHPWIYLLAHTPCLIQHQMLLALPSKYMQDTWHLTTATTLSLVQATIVFHMGYWNCLSTGFLTPPALLESVSVQQKCPDSCASHMAKKPKFLTMVFWSLLLASVPESPASSLPYSFLPQSFCYTAHSPWDVILWDPHGLALTYFESLCKDYFTQILSTFLIYSKHVAITSSIPICFSHCIFLCGP